MIKTCFFVLFVCGAMHIVSTKQKLFFIDSRTLRLFKVRRFQKEGMQLCLVHYCQFFSFKGVR